MSLLPERIGPYAIEGGIDHGGSAAVLLGRHRRLDRPVAIKLRMRGHSDDEDVLAERFRLGAILQADLDHPNIARVHDYIEATSHQALVLEYLSGGSVEARIADAPMPEAEALAVGAAVGLALEYAHRRGVIHRDLKPANLLFPAEGGPWAVRLNDFGVARSVHLSRKLTRPGANVGTLWYMPPEQFDGGAATPAVDVYSLGATLYEVLTGHLPFEAVETAEIFRRFLDRVPPPPLRTRNPSVSSPVAALIEQALSLDPLERPPSAGAFAICLQAIAEQAGCVVDDAGQVAVFETPAVAQMRALFARMPATEAGEIGRALFAFESRVRGPATVTEADGVADTTASRPTGLLAQMVEAQDYDDEDDDDDHTLVMMPFDD